MDNILIFGAFIACILGTCFALALFAVNRHKDIDDE